MSKTKTNGQEPYVVIMDVTPEMAHEWLKKNHEKNRKKRTAKIAEYAVDQKRGNWVLSDQCISFDTDGKLINGQNRLQAVCISGVTIRVIVLFNAPRRAFYVIDGGAKRTTDERFAMAGLGYPSGCGATVRRIKIGISETRETRAISDSVIAEFMTDYGHQVAFVHKITQKYKITNASIRAVLTRARIRRIAEARLERFCEVVSTGIMASGENAAVLLRNFIAKAVTKSVSGSSTGRRALYAMTETALTAFLADDPIIILKPTKVELFPIARDKMK
jgi:hypothetical protein